MKLLVFSDTHGCHETMLAAVRAEQPDMVIHLGDGVPDANALARALPQIPVVSLKGNCDGPTNRPEVLIQSYAGVALFMTHGHRYGVKDGLLRLSLAAREAGAQIALFGHTHQPLCEQTGGLWLLNPGPCPDIGWAGCGVIELGVDTVSCRLQALMHPPRNALT